MRIEGNETRIIELWTLDTGTIFRYRGLLYMTTNSMPPVTLPQGVTEPSAHDPCLAVDMESGQIRMFGSNTPVEPRHDAVLSIGSAVDPPTEGVTSQADGAGHALSPQEGPPSLSAASDAEAEAMKRSAAPHGCALPGQPIHRCAYTPGPGEVSGFGQVYINPQPNPPVPEPCGDCVSLGGCGCGP